jgi:hypothetical protein
MKKKTHTNFNPDFDAVLVDSIADFAKKNNKQPIWTRSKEKVEEQWRQIAHIFIAKCQSLEIPNDKQQIIKSAENWTQCMNRSFHIKQLAEKVVVDKDLVQKVHKSVETWAKTQKRTFEENANAAGPQWMQDIDATIKKLQKAVIADQGASPSYFATQIPESFAHHLQNDKKSAEGLYLFLEQMLQTNAGNPGWLYILCGRVLHEVSTCPEEINSESETESSSSAYFNKGKPIKNSPLEEKPPTSPDDVSRGKKKRKRGGKDEADAVTKMAGAMAGFLATQTANFSANSVSAFAKANQPPCCNLTMGELKTSLNLAAFTDKCPICNWQMAYHARG